MLSTNLKDITSAWSDTLAEVLIFWMTNNLVISLHSVSGLLNDISILSPPMRSTWSNNPALSNIIISAVAKKNNCESLILVNNSEYNKLKDVLGISKIVDPRKITVSKILKHIHQGKIESAYSIGNNQAEIIHAQALKTSRLINKNIEDAKLPGGIRLGLIKKKDKIIIPDKSTIIEQNDEVLFLCLTSDLKKAEELFQVRNVF